MRNLFERRFGARDTINHSQRCRRMRHGHVQSSAHDIVRPGAKARNRALNIGIALAPRPHEQGTTTRPAPAFELPHPAPKVGALRAESSRMRASRSASERRESSVTPALRSSVRTRVLKARFI